MLVVVAAVLVLAAGRESELRVMVMLVSIYST